jgi:hypothetical protein
LLLLLLWGIRRVATVLWGTTISGTTGILTVLRLLFVVLGRITLLVILRGLSITLLLLTVALLLVLL